MAIMKNIAAAVTFLPNYPPLILIIVFIVRYFVRKRRTNRPPWNPASYYTVRTKPMSEISTISEAEKANNRSIENDVFDLVSLSSEKEDIMESKELSYISSEEDDPASMPKIEDRSSNFELTSITCNY